MEQDAVPEKYLVKLMNIINAGDNDTVEDLSVPHIRPTVNNIYPLFIFMYGLIVVVGTLMNGAMMYHIIRHKLHRDPTYAFIINIAISDLVKCIFVLPITLAVLLIENWIFGQFLCYFLPILQDLPIHVSVMTYLLIAVDRYRFLRDSRRARIPAFVCAVGAWFSAVCIVLPHPIYTTYLDLELYQKKHFRGLGLCVTNLTDNIEQYMRGLFLLMYIAPLAVTVYVYVKASRELERPLAMGIYQPRISDTHSRAERTLSSGVQSIQSGRQHNENVERAVVTAESSPSARHQNQDDEAELDVWKEKRTQRYLVSMVSAFFVLFCPLMVLKLAKLSIVETYENTGILDVTFTLFVWLAFLSTITTPSFYVAWQMSSLMKQRLRTHLTFRKRRVSRSSKDVTEMTSEQVAASVASSLNVAHGRRERDTSLMDENIEIPSRIVRV